MEREISSDMEKLKGRGVVGGCQPSIQKIYHQFTFSQTHTQHHSLNTGQRLLNNLTWSHLQQKFSTITFDQRLVMHY